MIVKKKEELGLELELKEEKEKINLIFFSTKFVAAQANLLTN